MPRQFRNGRPVEMVLAPKRHMSWRVGSWQAAFGCSALSRSRSRDDVRGIAWFARVERQFIRESFHPAAAGSRPQRGGGLFVSPSSRNQSVNFSVPSFLR